MKCLKCGSDFNGRVCECGFNIAEDVFITIGSVSAVQLPETTYSLVFNGSGVWVNGEKAERLSDLRRHFPISQNQNREIYLESTDELLAAFGLKNLSVDNLNNIAIEISNELEQRVGSAMCGGLSYIELQQFDKIIGGDEDTVKAVLVNHKNYKTDSVYTSLLKKYKKSRESLQLLSEYASMKWIQEHVPNHREIYQDQLRILVDDIIKDWLNGIGKYLPVTMSQSERINVAVPYVGNFIPPTFYANWDGDIPIIQEERFGDVSHLHGYTERVNGYCFNRGYQIWESLNNLIPANPTTESFCLNMADIFITDMDVEDFETANALMSGMREDSDLLIIANNYSEDALKAIYTYMRKGKCAAVKAPGFGDRRKAMLADIALLTGARIASASAGMTLIEAMHNIRLGFAEHVVMQPDLTVIAHCMTDEKIIRQRIDRLSEEHSHTISDFDREKIAERIKILKNGVNLVVGRNSSSIAQSIEAYVRKNKADKRIDDRKEKDRREAQKAVIAISEIGAVVLSAKCSATILSARSAYDALTKEQKAYVSNSQVLFDAEKKYKALYERHQLELVERAKEQELREAKERELREQQERERIEAEERERLESEERVVRAVIELIENIGKISFTTECARRIQNARSAFNQLPKRLRRRVSNESMLVQAEEAYQKLQKEDSENREAAKSVDDLINAIGTVEYTENCRKKIAAARHAYSNLTVPQRTLVTRYKRLTDAEAEYKRLKTEAENREQSPKRMHRLLAIVSGVVLVIFAGGFIAGILSNKDKASNLASNTNSTIAVGDIITIGRYEQDGNAENGSEEIKWKVVEISDSEALLVSESALDELYFDTEETSWENSRLREWLNGYFFAAAFSENEQGLIIESEIVTKMYIGDNDVTENKSVDRIFIEDYESRQTHTISNYAKAALQDEDAAVKYKDDVLFGVWLRDSYVSDVRISESSNPVNLVFGTYDGENILLRASSSKNALVCPSMYIDLDKYNDFVKQDHSGDISVIDSYYTTFYEEFEKGLSDGAYKQVVYSRDRYCIYCLMSDGTVNAFGKYQWEDDANGVDGSGIDYSSWNDVSSLTLLNNGMVAGIKNDGTVLAYGRTYWGDIDVSSWKNIVQLDASNSELLLGLTDTGEVVFTPTESAYYSQEDIEKWVANLKGSKKIVSAETKDPEFFGLSDAGSVLYDYGIYTVKNGDSAWGNDVENWTNLADIAITSMQTDVIGLTKEGRVLYGGVLGYAGEQYMLDENILSSWYEVYAISAGARHLVALKYDGTVVATGVNGDGQCDVEEWQNITRIEAYGYTTVGYRQDGSILVVGEDRIKELASAPFTYQNAK